MGLAERRAVAAYQEKHYPAAVEEVGKAAGMSILIEPLWDTFLHTEAHYITEEAFRTVYFKPLVDGLKSIAADQMGRDALKKSLKKIVIDGSEGSSTSGFNFDDGVLKLQHMINTNLHEEESRTNRITKQLEEKL